MTINIKFMRLLPG